MMNALACRVLPKPISSTVLKFGKKKSQSPERKQTVGVYGASRVEKGTQLYKLCYKLGAKLAKAGYGVLTGGGPGAMYAVTEGAESKNGYTIGMAMPFIGEAPCKISDELHFFNTFSERLDIGYERRAGMTIAVPGGIGTLQELTKKAVELFYDKTLYPSQKQILLLEYRGYWKKFIKYLKKGPVAYGLMNPKILEVFKVVKLKDVVRQLQSNVRWTPGLVKLPSQKELPT